VSHPGRRIAVIMDASLSMLSPFSGQQLKTQSDTAFSNTMAAAEYFVRMRMKGKYRDLIALEQFGNEAYVITPFTTDYENLLLSLKMISDVNEWQRFPDQGTIIMKAIDEGVDLFKVFDFLKSSGNIMVIFSDGQDNNVQIGDMTLDQVLKKAVDNKVPVYMIRTAYARGLFDVIPDQVWKKAIDATGGRFYPAANQETIMQAIKEIDAAATGRVDVREYSVRQARYSRFALSAVLLWTLAIGLQMGSRMFRTFP
jgi:Ca-activated chloride channel family protein